MLDVSADRGWLVASLQVITLLQMVVQGHWWHDSSLLTLPHLELYHLPCFRYAERTSDCMHSNTNSCLAVCVCLSVYLTILLSTV